MTLAADVKKILFDEENSDDDTKLALLFRCAFNSVELEAALTNKSNGDDCVKSVRIEHLLRHPSLKAALADFMTDCIYESVPIVFLLTRRHRQTADLLCHEAGLFRNCEHFSGEDCAVCMTHVCYSCTARFARAADKTAMLVSTPVRFVSALVEAQFENDSTPLRSLSFVFSTMLRKCVSVAGGFNTTYRMKEHILLRSTTSCFESLAMMFLLFGVSLKKIQSAMLNTVVIATMVVMVAR